MTEEKWTKAVADKLVMNGITVLFTNAPENYDYPYIVKSEAIDGCRVLDCPTKDVEHQTGRNSSGLYWTTSDIEKAAYLRKEFPCEGEEI